MMASGSSMNVFPTMNARKLHKCDVVLTWAEAMICPHIVGIY